MAENINKVERGGNLLCQFMSMNAGNAVKGLKFYSL